MRLTGSIFRKSFSRRRVPIVTPLMLLFALVATCASLPSCSGSGGEKAPGDSVLHVFVSIPPQAYLARQIGGQYVDVDVLVEKGGSPHTFEPSPRVMSKLGEADAFIRAGMPFEKVIVDKIGGMNPDLKIFDSSKGIELLAHQEEEAEHDEHGHEHEGELDYHYWMSPELALVAAANMRDYMIELDPSNKAAYEENFQKLESRITELDNSLKELLAPLSGSVMYVYHPAFGYFAQHYGLKQVAIETGGKEPGAKHLASLVEKAKSENVKVIFVQPQFTQVGAEKVAQMIGGSVVRIDPLSEDYMGNLEAIAKAVSEAMEK